MILLKHKVLKNIVLRRTKIGRAADLALPPRIVSCIQCGCVCFQILKEYMLIYYAFPAGFFEKGLPGY